MLFKGTEGIIPHPYAMWLVLTNEILTDMLQEDWKELMQLGFFRAGILQLTTEHAQSKTSEEEMQMQELNCPTHPSQRQARCLHWIKSYRSWASPVKAGRSI